MGLRGRKAVVCASSQALGRACAQSLAQAGCQVVLNGRDHAVLERTADEIRHTTGATVSSVAGDIADDATQEALLAAADGAPDILGQQQWRTAVARLSRA